MSICDEIHPTSDDIRKLQKKIEESNLEYLIALGISQEEINKVLTPINSDAEFEDEMRKARLHINTI